MKLSTDLSAHDLRAKLLAYEPWFYRFEFPGGIATIGVNEYVEEIHANRAEAIFPHLERLFGNRWQEVRCLDIACHEGWVSLQLAQYGVQSVLGMDIRPERVEKATWLAETGHLPNARFTQGDLFALDAAHLGTFDIVLCIGVFYHLENPMGALRIARKMTRQVCVLEGQVAQGPGLMAGWNDTITARVGPGAVILPGEQVHAHEPTGIVIIPTLPALQQMLFAAGFREVHLVLPPPGLNAQFQTQDRVMLFAYV